MMQESSVNKLELSRKFIRKGAFPALIVTVVVLIVLTFIIARSSSSNNKPVLNLQKLSENKPTFNKSAIIDKTNRFIISVFSYDGNNSTTYMSDASVNNFVDPTLLASIKSKAPSLYSNIYDVSATVQSTKVSTTSDYSLMKYVDTTVKIKVHYTDLQMSSGSNTVDSNFTYLVSFQLDKNNNWYISGYLKQ